jgi:addiction module HigA family antidote
MPHKRLKPVHPGALLAEDLQERGISINRLARDTRMSLSRTSELVNGKRAITAETALRLARYFGTSPQYWMNLQSRYDLEAAQDLWADRIQSEIQPLAAA